jgi:hypothetical protein
MPRSDEFAADARRYSRAIWENLRSLKALQAEWNALDYGSTLPETIDGVAREDVGAAVFATADAIDALL